MRGLALLGFVAAAECIMLTPSNPPADAGTWFDSGSVFCDSGACQDSGPGASGCGDPTWADFWFNGLDPAGTGTHPGTGALATWVNKGTDSAVPDLDGVGSEQPTANVSGWVEFDGTNDRMIAAEATSNYPWVKGSNCSGCGFFHGVVFREAAAHTSLGILYAAGDLGTPNFAIYSNDEEYVGRVYDSPAACAGAAAVSSSAGSWGSTSFAFVPGDSGTECKYQTNATTSTAASGGSPPATDPARVLGVGARTGSAAAYAWEGDIYQVISINDPDAATVALAQAWLQCKAAEAAGL